MIEGLQPYPEYKESGLLWLGLYPSHWVIKRGKSYMTCVDQRSKTGKEELLTVSSARGVVPRSTATVTMFKAASYAGYKLCWPDDLVINSLWAWGRGLGVAQQHGIISTAYSVYRARPSSRIKPRYLHELVRSSPFNWELQVRSKGIWISRLQLTDTAFLNAPIPLPPPDEQTAIVRFLEHANRKIDAFIRAKRKLIGLLNEQKQAIIHRAVTRGLPAEASAKVGLDPNVPLKPSGVPWLGDIPRHWEVSFLRMRYSVELGKMLDAKKITGRHLVPYLRNRDVQWDKVHVDDLPLMDISPAEFRRYTVRKGDLLVCEGGQVGRCAFWNDELPLCGFQKALHRIRAHSPMRDFPRYLFYQVQLAARLGIFAADGNENTIAHLTCEKLRSHRFAFPPFSEQEEIAKHLDAELASLNTAIARTEREIALMQEYRTRLTADVVTGKLDVRPAAAKLPDLTPSSPEPATEEPEEAEPEEAE